MSRSVVWAIPNELIEHAIRSQAHIDGPVSVWAAGMDEVGEQVFVVLDIDEEDFEKLCMEDLDVHEFEEGELVQ